MSQINNINELILTTLKEHKKQHMIYKVISYDKNNYQDEQVKNSLAKLVAWLADILKTETIKNLNKYIVSSIMILKEKDTYTPILNLTFHLKDGLYDTFKTLNIDNFDLINYNDYIKNLWLQTDIDIVTKCKQIMNLNYRLTNYPKINIKLNINWKPEYDKYFSEKLINVGEN